MGSVYRYFYCMLKMNKSPQKIKLSPPSTHTLLFETYMALPKTTFYNSILVRIVLVWKALAETISPSRASQGQSLVHSSGARALLVIPEPLHKLEQSTLLSFFLFLRFLFY